MTANEEYVQYLTPVDLSERLQISTSTLASWRSLGKGPKFFRMGGLVRYHPSDVATWIKEQAA